MEAVNLLNKKNTIPPVCYHSSCFLVDNYLSNYHASFTTINRIQVRLTHFLKFIGKMLLKEIVDLDKHDISHITSEQVMQYKEELKSKMQVQLVQCHLNYIIKFLRFYEVPLIKDLESSKKHKIIIIQSFLKYLQDIKKFSQIHTYGKHINSFVKFLSTRYKVNCHSEYDFSDLELTNVLEYEKHQKKRFEKHQIKKIYAYFLLRTVSLFFKYLRKRNLSDIHYQPPRFLQRDRGRRNDYVEVDDMKLMIEAVFETTPDIRLAYRNMSIVLILIITGCRPIEISNMKIHDIWKTDYSALFKSKKSKNRKLKMNKTVMDSINTYLSFRSTFNPLDDSIFLTNDGLPMNSKAISNVLYKINIFAFGKSKNPAVSLRHTYITNACEAGYDLRKIASAAGHKILSSTEWYRHKSPERLKKNTLAHDPTQMYEKEFNL